MQYRLNLEATIMKFETLKMQIEDFQSSSTIKVKDAGNETRVRILKKILKLFGDVPDCRVQGRTIYPLNEVILMLFLATLAGSESCLSTQDFWMSNARHMGKCVKHVQTGNNTYASERQLFLKKRLT